MSGIRIYCKINHSRNKVSHPPEFDLTAPISSSNLVDTMNDQHELTKKQLEYLKTKIDVIEKTNMKNYIMRQQVNSQHHEVRTRLDRLEHTINKD